MGTIRDMIVYGGSLLLAVLPDPTDFIDFGLPIVEVGVALVYYLLFGRKKQGAK